MPTDTGELVGRLRAALGRHVVDASSRRRAEYSSDASNYRVVPEAVVFPRSADDVLTVVDVCRDLAVPVTVRGGGTSIAGNSVGPGVVLDMSRHLNQVVGIDPAARIATVQPGWSWTSCSGRPGVTGCGSGLIRPRTRGAPSAG